MKMMMMSPNIDDDDDVDSTVSTVSTPAKSRASRRAPHTALPREATRTRARTTRERRIRTRRERRRRRRRRILLITTLTTSCTYQRRSRFAMMMMMMMCVCARLCDDDTFDAFSRGPISPRFSSLLKSSPKKMTLEVHPNTHASVSAEKKKLFDENASSLSKHRRRKRIWRLERFPVVLGIPLSVQTEGKAQIIETSSM